MLLAGGYFCSCIWWSLWWENFEELLTAVNWVFVLLYYCWGAVATVHSFYTAGCQLSRLIITNKIIFATWHLCCWNFLLSFLSLRIPPQSMLLISVVNLEFITTSTRTGDKLLVRRNMMRLHEMMHLNGGEKGYLLKFVMLRSSLCLTICYGQVSSISFFILSKAYQLILEIFAPSTLLRLKILKLTSALYLHIDQRISSRFTF